MRAAEEKIRETFNSALLGAECAVNKITGGRRPEHLFWKNVKHDKIGTDVRIVRETYDSSFIAKYNEDGTISDRDFVILEATDLHIEESAEFAHETLTMFYNHIRDVKPDLIVITGDVIVSRFQQVDCVQFARFMEEIGIYWAVIFGNHEAREEKEFHKYFMLKNMAQYEHCLTKFGPDELFGYGNFFINIMSSEHTVSQSLAFFDSGRDTTEKYIKEYNVPEDKQGTDFIKENQIRWYENRIQGLKKEYGDVKSMLFTHIPVTEYSEVMTLDKEAKPFPTGIPTGKADILFGGMHENICCAKFNSGIFERARAVGAQAFFAGHDHINDFCAVYKGVYLVYVQSGGFDAYHMATCFDNCTADDYMQGVTLTTVHKDGSFDITRRFSKQYFTGDRK